jgi:hypothetical protein
MSHKIQDFTTSAKFLGIIWSVKGWSISNAGKDQFFTLSAPTNFDTDTTLTGSIWILKSIYSSLRKVTYAHLCWYSQISLLWMGPVQQKAIKYVQMHSQSHESHQRYLLCKVLATSSWHLWTTCDDNKLYIGLPGNEASQFCTIHD